MIGTSFLMLSFGIMIYSINTATAKDHKSIGDFQSNEYLEDGYVYFISDGYMYRIYKGNFNYAFSHCDKNRNDQYSHSGWNDYNRVMEYKRID